MYFITQVIRVYVYFSILVKLLSGYLLFAANFDDFHTIAKKLVAENQSGVSARNSATRDGYYDNDYEGSYEMKTKGHHLNTKRKTVASDTDDSHVDFEELVERVKKRIEKELKDKYMNKENKHNSNNGDFDDIETGNINSKPIKHKRVNKMKKSKATENFEEESPFEDDTEYVDEVTNKHENDNSNKTQIQDDRYEYADAIETTTHKKNKKRIHKEKYDKESTIGNNDDIPFKKIVMSKKDSYEDYKIPEKETNIYSSSENRQKYNKKDKSLKIEMDRKQTHQEYMTRQTRSTKRLKGSKNKSRTKKRITEHTDKTNSDEFESKKKHDHDETIILSKETTIKSKSGTNIPTRERYMTVTPNYNARLPTVVEKYDFDEPLPERDRERENLKPYSNPSALINKKIRLI